MKNGRALKGHRRVVTAIGPYANGPRKPPVGGWNLSCVCGWDGGNWSDSIKAYVAYRKHLDHQIDECFFKCIKCGQEKLVSKMRPDHRYVCLACYSDSGREWVKKHPVEAARHRRNHHLRRKFGITLEEAEKLLAAQDGVCAICKEPIADSRGYSPHVDHDHTTGRVRGILCMTCNLGIGVFKDDPARLIAAAQYLDPEAKP